MAYFSKFPKLVYDIKGDGNDALFTHILKRVKLHSAASANTKVFDYYQVVEGEKPEDIAHKYYGNANLHWVILLVNDIVDRFHQWPMTVPQFEQFVADKYDNPNGIHHYEISQDSGESTTKIKGLTPTNMSTRLTSERGESKIRKVLNRIDVNNMTPIEALQTLNALKNDIDT